jgi:hypothetical protein
MLGQLPHKRQVIHDFEKDLFVPKLLLTNFVQYGSEAKCKEAGSSK